METWLISKLHVENRKLKKILSDSFFSKFPGNSLTRWTVRPVQIVCQCFKLKLFVNKQLNHFLNNFCPYLTSANISGSFRKQKKSHIMSNQFIYAQIHILDQLDEGEIIENNNCIQWTQSLPVFWCFIQMSSVSKGMLTKTLVLIAQ